MRTPKPLGRLNCVRLWHDHSGREKYASWFLTAIMVIDPRTGVKEEFGLNQWLAAEKADGRIERTIPASGASQRWQERFIYHAGNI